MNARTIKNITEALLANRGHSYTPLRTIGDLHDREIAV